MPYHVVMDTISAWYQRVFCRDIRYTGPQYNDMLVDVGQFTFPGVADPTWQPWQPAGAGATFYVLKFQVNDEVRFSCQINHRYKEGTAIIPHVHWLPCDRGTVESGNTVGWKLDYTWANVGEVFPSSTTVACTGTCSGTNDIHELATGTAISLPGGGLSKISSMLHCRLYRSAADDTWVGATDPLSPGLSSFDFHVLENSPGSRQEWIK